MRRQRVRRRPRRPTRRARRVLATLAALVLGGAAAAGAVRGAEWLRTAPHLAVREIEVRGQSRLPHHLIIEAAGLAPGANLFALDAHAVVARVQALPGVRRATLVRSWPDRVTLTVEERQPFTLVHAGGLYWVDEEGVALAREARAVPLPLPVISGVDRGDVEGHDVPSARVRAGIALIRTLLRSGSVLLDRISEIDMSRADGPVLYTLDGLEVRLGGEDWDGRLPRLEGVLAQLALESPAQAVTGIDLRFRDQVVLTSATR